MLLFVLLLGVADILCDAVWLLVCKLVPGHVRQGEKEADHPRLVGGRFNKKGTHVPGTSWVVVRQLGFRADLLESEKFA